MNDKLANKILFAFILLTIIFKIYLVLQTPSISYDSYYGMRYAEYFHENFLPMVSDDLSYQGRLSITNIPFYMIVSLFTFIIPALIFFKYIGILFGAYLIYLIYKITQKLFNNQTISLIITFIAGMMQTIFLFSLNSFSSITVFSVLFLLLIWEFINLENKSNLKAFMLFFILATIITPYSIIVVLGFIVYFLLLKFNSLPIRKSTIDVFIFSSLFSIWYHLIIYKMALIRSGPSVIWQNIPQELISLSYQKLTILSALFFIGFVPLVLGLIGMYQTIFVKRKRLLILISSFTFVFVMLLALGILPLNEGIFLLLICLILLSANGLASILEYLDLTLFSKLKKVVLFLILVFVLLNFLPIILSTDVLTASSPNLDELNTMKFIQENTPDDVTILGDVVEGHFISYASNRKNFYDENFFQMKNADQKFADAKSIFLSKSTVQVVEQMKYYDIKYIYFSKLIFDKYQNVNFLIREDSCFKKIFSTNTTEVFELIC